MAADSRGKRLISIAKGVLTALGVTLCLMALMALMVVQFGLSDGALTAMNQGVKMIAIFSGVWACVGRGGQRGFALGAVTGLLYMVIAYGLYCLMDHQLAPALVLTGEFLMGAGLGALSGALLANLPPPKKRKPKKTVRAQAA